MPSARAQLGVGVWERQNDKGSKGLAGSMTMTVEPCCKGGYKLTYDININGTKSVMKVESPFDGTACPFCRRKAERRDDGDQARR